MNKKELLNYALSGEEMQKLNPEALIITYDKLNLIDDLSDLFDKFDKVIILYLLQNKYMGHWITLFINKNGLNVFDPLGVPPDYQLDKLNKKKRKILNQEKNRLNFLLNKYKYQVNNIIYQNPKTQVCGCFVSHRLFHYKLNNYEYLNIFIKNNIKNIDLFVAQFCHNKLLKLN
jgi:hypothetical protein